VTEISPEGTIWWCTHCGRIAADKQGTMAALGWTAECTQNTLLVHEESMKLDENGRVVQAAVVDKAGEATFPRNVDQVRVISSKGNTGAN
jgi:hypothetical protein